MYTLSRKLAVVCLTLVLSVLVYGCGGSSKQALITDVSTDMVTTGLTPDSGTYLMQPGGTATAGDVTFTCPKEGSPCEVTVADDGTVTSAGGMATAMDSDSATARAAAVAEAMTAETARAAAVAEAMTAETARAAAVAEAMTAETARAAAVEEAMTAETARAAAVEEAMTAETARAAAVEEAMTAETARAAAVAEAMTAETARAAAVEEAMTAETARAAAVAEAMTAETARAAAVEEAMTAETARAAAVAEAMTAEAARAAAVAEAMTAEAARAAAVAEAMTAEAARAAAVAETMTAETARAAAVEEAMTAETARAAAVAEAMTAEAARAAAVAETMTAETARAAAVAEAMTAETARAAAVEEAMTAETARAAAVAEAMTAETARAAAVEEAMTAETARAAAVAEAMTAEAARAAAVAEAMTAEAARAAAVAEAMTAEAARAAAVAETMTAETARAAAVEKAMTAETARLAAEKEARLLTTVTSIEPELAADFARVATTDIYKVEPGHTKTVPNSDVKIYCPAEGLIRCTVVIAVNEAGMVTYTSLGGVATIVNTDDALHTKMAIALFSPTASAGGLNAQATTLGVDNPPLDDMIGVERSVDGRTTTFTLTHNVTDEEDNKYTSDEPVDIGHGITNWIGRTLKRDNGDEDITATREDEGTFYTNIMKAEPGKWKVSGNEVPLLTYAFVIDPDQVISTEHGATFTGAYVTEDGNIPGTYTCVNVGTTCSDPGDPNTSLETGKLILSMALDANWQFESDNDVKKGNVADKDYMYYGYWLQMPVKQSDSDNAESYEFKVYSGGTGENVFSVNALLLDDLDGYTAVYKGGAAGRYVTRNLQFKDEVADPLSPGFHGRFTATAELTAYFGEVSRFAAEGEDIPNRQNMLGGSINDFKDGGKKLDFEVTLTPVLMVAGELPIESDSAEANFGGDVSGGWSANFYGPNAATTNAVATNNTLPSGVAGQFDASSKYTKVIGAFAAEKQ